MSKQKNRLTLDGTLHAIHVARDDRVTRFVLEAARVGAGGTAEHLPCVAFGRAATWVADALDTIDTGEEVRVTGGLRVEDGRAVVIVDSVRPIYHRDD